MNAAFRLFGPALLALLTGSPATAQKPPAPAAAPPASKNVLQDRVLAVVDEDPVLASDVERVIRLGLDAPNPGENDEAFRKRVLNALIDQRLQFHEVDRFGFQQVPVEEIEKRVKAIRARFPDEASFQKALKEVGLDLKGLRQLMARQLLVLTYVDERLGPRVFVTPDDIDRYYRQVLTPEMQKRGQPVPKAEEVRDDIRETLKQQKTTQEVTAWTRELRQKADIVTYPGSPAGKPLPPVVKTIQAAPKKEAAKKPPRF
jgi:peptidyl-prolyl cis-trans isomerase SurA